MLQCPHVKFAVYGALQSAHFGLTLNFATKGHLPRSRLPWLRNFLTFRPGTTSANVS
jgi:hypothetical protein